MLYFLYHGVLWCYCIIAKDWCKSVQWCWFWHFLSLFACYVLLLSVNKCSCTVWVLFFGSISDFVSFFQVQTLILCLFASSQSVFTCPIRLCGQTVGWLGAFCLPTGSMRWVQWASHLICAGLGGDDSVFGHFCVFCLVILFFFKLCRIRTRKLLWAPLRFLVLSFNVLC